MNVGELVTVPKLEVPFTDLEGGELFCLLEDLQAPLGEFNAYSCVFIKHTKAYIDGEPETSATCISSHDSDLVGLVRSFQHKDVAPVSATHGATFELTREEDWQG